ncbi:hypothetical protein HER32_02825 [Hymenobacter sp. BT18]|uniref:DUF6705 family protein n=1 Tax=Hymenobacter sp. BT18 TaxID=2835648 RepID=UPI00143EA933|nr:DUF6705 family protein [Hymenobacter sp. BT18]QIX60176.1 hypothetical protein HER32_02825 [Hymenobacter sp. BT18]
MMRGLVTFILYLLSAYAQAYAQPGAKPRQAAGTVITKLLPRDEPPAPVLPAEQFLGTWEWRSGTDVFRVTFTRNRFYQLPNGTSMHVVIGRHWYTRSGVIIENSTTNSLALRYGHTLLGRLHEDWSIDMGFTDLTKNKPGRAQLTINPTTPNKLQFTLRELEGGMLALPNTPTPAAGFTIPTTMTLTRVP